VSTRAPCPICTGMESETVDRLLLIGYGPRFVSARWGHDRKDVARHRDRCLVGGRLESTQAALERMGAGVTPDG
jgi:hypothetical protein